MSTLYKFLVSFKLIFLLALSGCTSHVMSMKYEPTVRVQQDSLTGSVAVGTVTDSRNTAPNWLGAIRGGYGNVLKKLYTSDPTIKEVKRAFESALSARGLLEKNEPAKYSLNIRVKKFDASQMFRKEAHAHLEVSVFENESSGNIYTREYQVDNSAGGSGPGVFGSPSDLGNYANQALNESIDQVFNDRSFLDALRPSVRSNSGNQAEQASRSLSDRLDELGQLKDQGLISEEEYKIKRKSILDSL